MLSKILDRVCYGASPRILERIKTLGFKKFIQTQLNPTKKDNPKIDAVRDAFVLGGDEQLLKNHGFEYINADLNTIWSIYLNKKKLEQQTMLPAYEVVADTCIRAIYSDWQLYEIMVQFWHNHFNVSIDADEKIALCLPLYDREVIRKHALGNFRVFLEAVAQSPAMLFYLDNAYSRASPANENYARELFELHTLGEDNYLNHLYNRWKEVPGAESGTASGYIDEDIYEAARAFTGWTVADGAWTEDGDKPNTGAFMYIDKWHDNYQKRILGLEFRPNQAPMEDGKKVLDLLAYHPGTARFICTKLCRRFIADDPPELVINQAVTCWIEQQHADDQIKKVIETILLSDAFMESLGKKIKNPYELTISAIRVLNLDFVPKLPMKWLLNQMGYQLFSWPTPPGHPDCSDYWLNSSMLLKRWNVMPSLLMSNWHKMVDFDPSEQHKKEASSLTIVDYWLTKILGSSTAIPSQNKKTLLAILLKENRQAGDPALFYSSEDKRYRLLQIICLILMSPQFQAR